MSDGANKVSQSVSCNDLRWDAHVDALCSKVASILYFLKLLKRSGVSADDLLCFYKSVIRSVLEYGSVVSHHHLTHVTRLK